MAPIFLKLDQLGIEPLKGGIGALQVDDLVERVRRSAQALRAQWQREREDMDEEKTVVGRRNAVAAT